MLKVKEYKGQEVSIIQYKYDGHRISVKKRKDGSIYITGKRDPTNLYSKLKQIFYIEHLLHHLPCDSEFEAEMYGVGIQATSVPTLVNDASSFLQIMCFKIHRFAGSIPGTLEIEQVEAASIGLPYVETEYIPNGPRSLTDREVEMLRQKADKMGLEGFVVKKNTFEKWYKIKPIRTVDCVVVGTTKSTSATKYGALKAIQVAVYKDGSLVDIASVGGGFTDEFRFSVDPETLIGRVAEVAYDSLAAKGQLKFPRFLRWRDDEKLPTECSIEQLY